MDQQEFDAVKRDTVKRDAVRTEAQRLDGATDAQLIQFDRERAERRRAWLAGQAALPGEQDPLENAYRMLLRKLDIPESEAPIVHKSADRIVFHSRNFCPTLEACKLLGLDTRRVCRLYNSQSPDALVKQVDPRLSFSRNYQRIRPFQDVCEESISFAG